MRLALIADTFPPLRSSGAIQLRDLAREFLRQGHELTVLLPSPGQPDPWRIEDFDGVQILRLKAPLTKDVGYVRRTFAEFMMPFAMGKSLRFSPLANVKWDGIVWYAPSIFHGPLVNSLKRVNKCKGYLIIRDIFPEWAVDMGLMSRGLPYRFFDAVARYQYSVANVIGVQTQGNLAYFKAWSMRCGHRLEVLQNWLAETPHLDCSIKLERTSLKGKKVFVYAGNMGVAQGLGILLDLAEDLRDHKDIGFLFVGRGSEAKNLASQAVSRKLNNVLFCDEIHPDEISALYAQCTVGIVALDPRHKSHNIPGKFLSYMQSGLPVLANLNAANDLCHIIRDHNVGRVSEDNRVDTLARYALELANTLQYDEKMSSRCISLFRKMFSVETAARQIIEALTEMPSMANEH